MVLAGGLRIAFADDGVAVHEHAAYAWVGRGREESLLGQRQGALHHGVVEVGEHGVVRGRWS